MIPLIVLHIKVLEVNILKYLKGEIYVRKSQIVCEIFYTLLKYIWT